MATPPPIWYRACARMLPHARHAPADRRSFLDPAERTSEVLFGLIMVLTFTGSLSAASAGHAEVRTMLAGAIGCNVAWGIIDAIMYLMACLAEHAGHARTLRALREARDLDAARRVIEGALTASLAKALAPADLDRMAAALAALPLPEARRRLRPDDWLGALGVFLWVLASALPVVVPFLVVEDAARALRVSNAVAVVLLFGTGIAFGRSAGLRPALTGAAMVLVGLALVGLTMALGG